MFSITEYGNPEKKIFQYLDPYPGLKSRFRSKYWIFKIRIHHSIRKNGLAVPVKAGLAVSWSCSDSVYNIASPRGSVLNIARQNYSI